MPHKRLFIPGPTEVTVENLAALSQPQMGHRSAEFTELYGSVVPRLQQLLETKERVFLFTSSSTGVWEAAIRNCVARRVLCCMQGAFSDRWMKVGCTLSSPDDDLAARPDGRVLPSWFRCSRWVENLRPCICRWVVPETRIRVPATPPAPHNHFGTCPHSGVALTRIGIYVACRQPLIAARNRLRRRWHLDS